VTLVVSMRQQWCALPGSTTPTTPVFKGIESRALPAVSRATCSGPAASQFLQALSAASGPNWMTTAVLVLTGGTWPQLPTTRSARRPWTTPSV
jgi:hypothetical protein